MLWCASLRSVLLRRLDRVVLTCRASMTTTRKPSARSPTASQAARLRPGLERHALDLAGKAADAGCDLLDLGRDRALQANGPRLVDDAQRRRPKPDIDTHVMRRLHLPGCVTATAAMIISGSLPPTRRQVPGAQAGLAPSSGAAGPKWLRGGHSEALALRLDRAHFRPLDHARRTSRSTSFEVKLTVASVECRRWASARLRFAAIAQPGRRPTSVPAGSAPRTCIAHPPEPR